MLIKVRILKSSNIRNIVRTKYRELYNARKAALPNDSGYTLSQLAQNIKNALSINDTEVNLVNIKNPTLNRWVENGWKQTYYAHWYFGGIIKTVRNGALVFVVKDAVYEGDYHNDIMTTKPYDESKIMIGGTLIKESFLRNIVQECIKEVLQEECKCDYKLGPYECVYGTFRTLLPDSLQQFGLLNDIMMYFSPSQTYCLLRQEKSHKYFFAKIVDAPELGKDETKFVLVKPNDVPSLILRDAKALIRTERNRRTEIS